MKAMQLTTENDMQHLREVTLASPEPLGTQVLVRVVAAGVTPTELSWYPTTHNRDGSTRTLAIPGHEFSGTVAGKGPQASGYAIGDSVFGMNDWFEGGATAEFCLADPGALAAKPTALSHEEAASVPIAALTAWQGLILRAKLRAGDRVLVHGGAGSVGAFAVQVAALQGAHVVATGTRSSFEYMRALGAAECVDYQTERFEERAPSVDVCFDTVGGDTLARSWQILGDSGRMVTIASDAELSADTRVKQAFFIVEPSGAQLAHITSLLGSGKLRASVKAVLPFEEAPRAYTEPLPGFGKTVLRIAGHSKPS